MAPGPPPSTYSWSAPAAVTSPSSRRSIHGPAGTAGTGCCFDTPDAVSLLRDERVSWAHHPTTRNLPNLLRNLVLAWRLLSRERPDVVMSTGAGTALPFFVVARLRGIPTVYLEVYDRIDTPTLTGRLCRPFTDRMLVQWDEQARLYRGAEVVGVVL